MTKNRKKALEFLERRSCDATHYHIPGISIYQEGCEQVGLTKDLFEKWMVPTANELESNRYRRVNELINFSRFLNDLGIAS